MPKSNAAPVDTQTATPKTAVSAAEMGARQREISVSEFFTKNRHLLGFDNPRKALLTCVKEAVDNALDACEEAGILPEVIVKVEVAANGVNAPAPSQANRFRVTVIDYGPGIVRQQIPRIFEQKQIEWENHRGTQVTLEIEGRYQKGRGSVDEYLEQTAIANPHVKLAYHTPEGDTKEYPRTIEELPPQPREIKPHPYGIEFGMMLKMLHDTKSHSLAGFLSSEFSRVSSSLAQEICKAAKLSPDTRPRNLHGAAAETFYKAIQSTKIMAPPSNCISPIGEKAILHGLYKQIKGDFYTAVTRPPAVYRGNPFVIEAGLAFGKGPEQAAGKREQPKGPLAEGESHDDDNELASVIRYANRVPLLYQQSACATFKAVLDTTWRNYGVAQSRGALPAGPMVIFVHMASVWVPFTSESKEAIADYDEIRKEIKLALQECGRRLGVFLRRREHAKDEFRRRNIFELYIEEVVEACNRLKGGKLAKEKLKDQLQKIASKRTGGEKTDEILGRDGGGPEGLPHSIIVTAEGTEGEALTLPSNEQNAVEAPQEIAADEQEPALPTMAKGKAKSKTKDKNKATKVTKQRGAQAESTKQMTLGFEKAKSSEGRSQKTGKKHGAKKTKK